LKRSVADAATARVPVMNGGGSGDTVNAATRIEICALR